MAIQTGAQEHPNVLFIAFDDLNDWVGCLGGHPNAKTPNIDALAKRGMLFTNAACPAPICNPSRASIMSGMLPSTSGVYDNSPFFRGSPVLKDVATMPQYFQQHGYAALRTGKIFHNQTETDPQSWDAAFPSLDVHKPDASVPEKYKGMKQAQYKWETGALPLSDAEMDDGMVADWAIGQLEQKHDKPFFLAVGMYHPHLPWFAPKKYFDMHPIDTVQLPIINLNDRDDIPAIAQKFNTNAGHKRYKEFTATKELWREKVQAYLAATSFADAQVGRVLQALENSEYADNTVIVLWSDHGWHLGEKLHWTKYSLWEEAARVPLIFAGTKVPKVGKCDVPVSLVNLYPTLANLCGLPANPANDGMDMTPLLENPALDWERPALTTHGVNNHSVRTKRWRYTRWSDGSEELYDHDADPLEWKNLADNPEHAALKIELSKWFPTVNAPDAKPPKKNRKRKKQ
ncbi:sulfatase [Pontiella sulfatireligans]|uniref:sulfatase n=1 Tax=Pontiella sulfatireligans TaxID=2750658 RepID=UPI001443D9F6|nr:sulfatase [Pontiella sulfatireligans]